MILSLRMPMEHVITGRTEELSITLGAFDRRCRRSTEFTLLQGLRFQLNCLSEKDPVIICLDQDL